MHLQSFLDAVETGVRTIANGKLRKLNNLEKQGLLAILRKRDDCPVGWKKKDRKKQRTILISLHNAIK